MLWLFAEIAEIYELYLLAGFFVTPGFFWITVILLPDWGK